jgi:hypothetical protein
MVWAIGGTTMLYLRGVIATAPRDLDTFTTHGDFDAVCSVLTQECGPCIRPPHGTYASDRFATFTSAEGIQIDVIAGAAVMRDGARQAWHFEPTHTEMVAGLPLMSLNDWLALYRLFDRPHRVEQIEAYLRRNPGAAS